jgi:DNA-binding MarR family transcriptional regulator
MSFQYKPERFMGLSVAQRLVWFYIYFVGPGEHSARSLAQELDINHHTAATAIKTLREKGLLEEITPARGRRGAELKAV